MATNRRLYFLDNLRVALIMLVIAHHVAQTYGPTGGDWPIGEQRDHRLAGPLFRGQPLLLHEPLLHDLGLPDGRFLRPPRPSLAF